MNRYLEVFSAFLPIVAGMTVYAFLRDPGPMQTQDGVTVAALIVTSVAVATHLILDHLDNDQEDASE